MSSDESIFRRVGNRIVEFEGLGRSQGGRGTTDLGDEVIEFDRIADPDDIGEASAEDEDLGITIDPRVTGAEIPLSSGPFNDLRSRMEPDVDYAEARQIFERTLEDVAVAEPSFKFRKVVREDDRSRPMPFVKSPATFGSKGIAAIDIYKLPYNQRSLLYKGIDFDGTSTRPVSSKTLGKLFRGDIWEECRQSLESLILMTPSTMDAFPRTFGRGSESWNRVISKALVDVSWCIRVASVIGIMRRALNCVHLEAIDEEARVLPDQRVVAEPESVESIDRNALLRDPDAANDPGKFWGDAQRVTPFVWYGPYGFDAMSMARPSPSRDGFDFFLEDDESPQWSWGVPDLSIHIRSVKSAVGGPLVSDLNDVASEDSVRRTFEVLVGAAGDTRARDSTLPQHIFGLKPTIEALRNAAAVYAALDFGDALKKCITKWMQANYGGGKVSLSNKDAVDIIEEHAEERKTRKKWGKKYEEWVKGSEEPSRSYRGDELREVRDRTEEQRKRDTKETKTRIEEVLSEVKNGSRRAAEFVGETELAFDSSAKAADSLLSTVQGMTDSEFAEKSSAVVSDTLEVSGRVGAEATAALNKAAEFSGDALRHIEEMKDGIDGDDGIVQLVRTEIVSSVASMAGVAGVYIDLALNLVEQIFGGGLSGFIADALDFLLGWLFPDGPDKHPVKVKTATNPFVRIVRDDGAMVNTNWNTTRQFYEDAFAVMKRIELSFQINLNMRTEDVSGVTPRPELMAPRAANKGIAKDIVPRPTIAGDVLRRRAAKVFVGELDSSTGLLPTIDRSSGEKQQGSGAIVAGIIGATGIAIPVGVALFQQGIIGSTRQIEAEDATPPEDEREAEEEEEA